MRQCECVAEKARARYLALIPERFKDSSFESFKPRDPKQERALSLMRKDPGGSWYLTGAYGNGKTHLLYAQYREIVISGKVRCHVRTTRELVEELRRAEFDEDFVSPVIAAASRASAVPPVLGRHRQAEADGLQNRGPLRSGRQPLPPEARPDRDRKLFDA